VIFDIANMSMGQGHEPTKMGLDLLGPYVQHVHAGGGRPVASTAGPRDSSFWDWETVDLADSVIDVPQFTRELGAMDYQGFVSVEDFRAVPAEGQAVHTAQLPALPGLSRGSLPGGLTMADCAGPDPLPPRPQRDADAEPPPCTGRVRRSPAATRR